MSLGLANEVILLCGSQVRIFKRSRRGEDCRSSFLGMVSVIDSLGRKTHFLVRVARQ